MIKQTWWNINIFLWKGRKKKTLLGKFYGPLKIYVFIKHLKLIDILRTKKNWRMENKKIYIKKENTKPYIYFSKITFQNTHGCIFNMKKWMENIVPFLIKEEICIEFKIMVLWNFPLKEETIKTFIFSLQMQWLFTQTLSTCNFD